MGVTTGIIVRSAVTLRQQLKFALKLGNFFSQEIKLHALVGVDARSFAVVFF